MTRTQIIAITTAFGALLLGGAAAGGDGSSPQLQRLMQALAQHQHDHVVFTEHQFIAVLDRPLESSGELFFDAPDRLEKRTLVPKPESVVLEKGNVVIRRGAKIRSFALSDYPQFGLVIDSIRATVGGNLESLQRYYHLEFQSGAVNWTLTLVPRSKALAAQIVAIRVVGAAEVIREIQIRRSNGDRSDMLIEALPGG